MKKASFYHSFKVIDSSLSASTEVISFSVYRSIDSCSWADSVGRKVTSSFESDNSRFISDLTRQFNSLASISDRLPSGDSFDYPQRHSSILNEIQSCRVGE